MSDAPDTNPDWGDDPETTWAAAVEEGNAHDAQLQEPQQ